MEWLKTGVMLLMLVGVFACAGCTKQVKMPLQCSAECGSTLDKSFKQDASLEGSLDENLLFLMALQNTFVHESVFRYSAIVDSFYISFLRTHWIPPQV